ncbi:hypothetical protein [Paenibacillus vietnamensis]|nr:hypothetical protein [Paenibacillus vietnamensis]
MDYVIAGLLIVIVGLLLHINQKIPSRDVVKEAMERDRIRKGE